MWWAVEAAGQEPELEALLAECTVCHGDAGISADPSWPHIAGQKRGYLIARMRDFRDRPAQGDPAMAAAMQDVSDERIAELATHYAALAPAGAPASEARAVNRAGQNVRAYCISCHGVQGRTVNQEWPNLAGQHADYLYRQLLAYRDGKRMSPLMNVIAREFSERQLRDVAEYYSQLVAQDERVDP